MTRTDIYRTGGINAPSTPSLGSHRVPSLQSLHTDLQKRASNSLYPRANIKAEKALSIDHSSCIPIGPQLCTHQSFHFLSPTDFASGKRRHPSSLAPATPSVRWGQRCKRLFVPSGAGLRMEGIPCLPGGGCTGRKGC